MNHAIQNRINNRLKQLKKNGIQYISGTISPAESDKELNDIESLDKALDYFAEKNPEAELCLQPKWMGSRCQIYLHRDNPELNFGVTRNGFKVKLDLTEIYASLESIFERIDGKHASDLSRTDVISPASKVILDGELLPWSAIGSGLIKREFEGLIRCVEDESEFLLNNNYGVAISHTIEEEAKKEFDVDKLTLTKKELAEKYPRYESYQNVEYIREHFVAHDIRDLDEYKKQLDLYAGEGELQFKPFDILRVDFKDGSFNVDDGWMGFVDHKYNLLTSISTGFEDFGRVIKPDDFGRRVAKTYFDNLTKKGYEGMCIKPVNPKETDAVHCMKVRNKDYLRIIYGFDYQRPDKLEALVQKKRVGKKRKLSHNEYKLGIQMLKLDANAVDYEEQYDRIAKQILFEIEEESTLDTRL